jgi:hypothetical protein
MTFLCPNCGRIIDGRILTDEQMIDHEMQVETSTAQRDTLQGMVTNAQKMVWEAQDELMELMDSVGIKIGIIEEIIKRANGELNGR